MTRRRYSSAATETALTNSINNSQTAVVVDAVTGYPGSFPYEGILEEGTASEECVLVTAGTGGSLTVTRGYDGTAGLSHAAGAKFVHGVSAIDFDEANAHVNETTTAHGVTLANLVTKTGIEVLTNKDLTAGSNTFPASLATDAEVAPLPRGTLGHTPATGGGQGSITTAVDLTGLTTTVVVPSGRRVRITGYVAQAGSTVSTDAINLIVLEDGVQITSATIAATTAGTLTAIAVRLPAAGSRTYKLQMSRTGTGDVTMTATASAPAFILVEDIGV